ncbi:hypothetical protein TSUD_169020 [Trifolium subterraneum]|nr:hypothetical protein TSUD_169020 [Trifolium subterraneum]
MVDDALVEIKIVEEWGYAMGEDTCLFEEENASEATEADCEEGQVEPDVGRSMDLLVDQIAVELEETAKKGVHGRANVESSDKLDDILSDAGEYEGESVQPVDIPSPACAHSEGLILGSQGNTGDCDLKIGDKPQILESMETLIDRDFSGEFRREAGNQTRYDRANSCPPVANRSFISGPWSLEWLHDHEHGEAGVIFSATKGVKEGGRLGTRHSKEGQLETRRRRAGGLLRHPVLSLKKVARLPREDRVEVLKVLNKSVLRHQKGAIRSCNESS